MTDSWLPQEEYNHDKGQETKPCSEYTMLFILSSSSHDPTLLSVLLESGCPPLSDTERQ